MRSNIYGQSRAQQQYGKAKDHFPKAVTECVNIEVMKLVPKESINERIVEMQVLLVSEETVEVVKLVQLERINERFVDVPVCLSGCTSAPSFWKRQAR